MKKILNKRLEMISAFINSNDRVIDIGCDHGLLGIYLVNEKNVKRMISSDINIKPLEKARENTLKYHLEDKIEIKLGNGLETIDSDIDTIIISGMGGITITKILSDIKKYPDVKKIIISPNSDFKLTRKEISKLGFMLVKETLAFENNKYYLISEYQKGKCKINNYFGKLDLNDQKIRDYYENLYEKNKKIISQLSIFNKIKKINLLYENYVIKKYLKKFKIIV